MDNTVPGNAGMLSPVGWINKYRKQLMGVAALLIFLFHHWTTVIPQLLPNHTTLAKISLFVLTHGHCGVDIFFLISGIGLVWAADKHSVGEFYIRRVKKVFVPFLIAYSVLVPLTGGSFVRWLSLVSGYSFLFENMYSVLWFVPAIMLLYLLFPLYNLLLKKLKYTVAVTAGFLVLWYLGARFLPIRYDLLGFYNRIPIFLLGVMLGRLEKNGKFPKSRLFAAASIPLLVAGVFSAHYTETLKKPLLVRLPNCFIPTLCLALGLVLGLSFILDLAHRARVSGRIADVLTAPLSYLGGTSLSFYLVQMFTFCVIPCPPSSTVFPTTSPSRGKDTIPLLVAVGLSSVLHAVTELLNGRVLRLPGGKHGKE